MRLATSAYPTIFRRKEVLYITLIFNRTFLSDNGCLAVELQQYAFSKQYVVVVLQKADIINASIINGENLPVRLVLHFQLGCEIQACHVKDMMQCFFTLAQENHIIHIAEIIQFHTKSTLDIRCKNFLNPMVEISQIQVG